MSSSASNGLEFFGGCALGLSDRKAPLGPCAKNTKLHYWQIGDKRL